MNKLDYHSFYEQLWLSEDFVNIISDDFIDNEKDFIREFTREIYRQYDLKFESRDPISFNAIKKLFEITFSNLAIYSPRTDKIKPSVVDSREPFKGY